MGEPRDIVSVQQRRGFDVDVDESATPRPQGLHNLVGDQARASTQYRTKGREGRRNNHEQRAFPEYEDDNEGDSDEDSDTSSIGGLAFRVQDDLSVSSAIEETSNHSMSAPASASASTSDIPGLLNVRRDVGGGGFGGDLYRVHSSLQMDGTPPQSPRPHYGISRTVQDTYGNSPSSERVLLYHHPSTANLAFNICELCKSEASRQRLHIRKQVELRNDIRWDHFRDGFPNIFIKHVHDMIGRDVIFLASFYPSANIFEQLSLLLSLPRYLAKSLTVILPYFPTGTMERVDEEGQIATAMTLARLLSAMPLTRNGPPQILIFDIHALPERFYFGNEVIPRLETALPLLKRELRGTTAYAEKKIAICFPDEGASKRFGRYFDDKYAKVVCSKVRNGDRRDLTIKEMSVESLSGLHTVIVDDLVQTGGTIINCAKLMREKGAKHVSAYVTHPVFPQQSWKRIQEEQLFDTFWCTDSCPEIAKELDGQHPFKVLSLAPLIAKTLLTFDFTR